MFISHSAGEISCNKAWSRPKAELMCKIQRTECRLHVFSLKTFSTQLLKRVLYFSCVKYKFTMYSTQNFYEYNQQETTVSQIIIGYLMSWVNNGNNIFIKKNPIITTVCSKLKRKKKKLY